MSTILQQPRRGRRFSFASSFQTHMVLADLVILALSVVGCKLTAIHMDIGHFISASLMIFMLLLAALLFLYRDNKNRTLASILTVPWIILLIPILVYPMLIAGRLDLPLQDAHLARIGQMFGVNVHSIVAWAIHHPIGGMVSDTYSLLIFFLVAAALVPAFTGKLKSAREFIVANLVAIAIGIPLFALLPAVGPWYFYHFHPSLDQARYQAQFLLLRSASSYNSSEATGFITFPSFHVIWSILCPAALWDFRILRIPAVVLSIMIILSTMTTGWHYFGDVLGGLLVGGIAVVASKAYTRKFDSDFQ